MKIGIIGKGNVGTALASGLKRSGHDIRFGHRDPEESVSEAAKWGEVIILAVPYGAVKAVAKEIGSAANGKVVVDVTNALNSNGELAIGFTSSAAEGLQKALPRARVVKAFNTVFAHNQSTGKVGGEQLSAFIAGDDAEAKRIVIDLAKGIGFDPIDCGSLRTARYLEPMAMFIIGLGYSLKMGTNIGLKLVKT